MFLVYTSSATTVMNTSQGLWLPFILLSLACLQRNLFVSCSLNGITVMHDPKTIVKMMEIESRDISISFVVNPTDASNRFFAQSKMLIRGLEFEAYVTNGAVLQVHPQRLILNDLSENVTITISGKQMGRSNLSWILTDSSGETETAVIPISVIRSEANLQLYFTIFVGILVTINNINMGCFIELKTIKAVLKKPYAPMIGFGCQFLFMPLASYVVGLLLFPRNTSWRLGLFVLGCCPGGVSLIFFRDIEWLNIVFAFVLFRQDPTFGPYSLTATLIFQSR